MSEEDELSACAPTALQGEVWIYEPEQGEWVAALLNRPFTSGDRLATDGIAMALDSLDDRSRRIVEERWLKVNDDGSGGMTLHELAAVYGVSAERIRQIEVAAMKKMKKALAEFA